MLNVIVREGLIDEDFIAAHTNDWDATRGVIEKYTPDVASQISGVPAGKDRGRRVAIRTGKDGNDHARPRHRASY